MRRLSVLIAQLPEGSATWAKRAQVPPGWTTQTWLLADLFHAMSGEKHPARPVPSQSGEGRKYDRTAALLDHKRRMAEREALLTKQEADT